MKKLKTKIFTLFLLSINFVSFANNDILSGENTRVDTSKNTSNYINKNNDSEIIGNYFKGYYFDKAYGLFNLDWSSDLNKNIRVVDSTNKCSDGSYGYKIGGYAKSNIIGLINFNYNNETFVYYCTGDKKLHGNAYSKVTGKQSFEGIGFDIVSSIVGVNILKTSDPFFVNNSTMILTDDFSQNATNNNTTTINSKVVSGEKKSVEYGSESIFYIFKPKK